MVWIPWWSNLWMVCPFISAPIFVSVTPYMGILFPILEQASLELTELHMPLSP
jgi:hypothetical protein